MSILYKIANNSGSVVQVLAVQNSQIKLINLLSGEITVSEEFTNQMKTLRDRGLIEIVNLDATIIPVVPETEVEDFEDLPLEGDYIGQFIKVNSQNAYYRWFGNRWKKFIDTETILNSAYDENTGSLLTQLTGSNIPEAQALPIKAMASENKIGSVRQVKFPSPVTVQKVTNTVLYCFAQVTNTDGSGVKYGVSGGKIIYRAFDTTGAETGFEQIIFTPPEGWAILATAFRYRFNNGRILIVCRNSTLGKSGVFVSDLAEDTAKTFTQVLEMEASPYSQWGWDIWGDMVFIAEYDGYTTPAGAGNGRYIYMSRDQGLTWSTILDRLDETTGLTIGDPEAGMHFHDVGYDPWTNMVWACCGDGSSWANVLYTYDFGLTWYELFEGGLGDNYMQFLCVCATPEYIILSTDHPGENGIYVMRKPQPLSRQGGEFTPDMLELCYLDHGREGFIDALFANFRYIDGCWYCASVNTTSPFNPTILTSANGYDWFELYRHERVATKTAAGVKFFFRDGNDMYCIMRDDENNWNQLLRIPIPTWITI